MEKGQVEYAVYRGDEFQCYGTREECAKKLNVTLGSFRTYMSRSGEKPNGIHIVNLGRWADGEEIEEV